MKSSNVTFRYLRIQFLLNLTEISLQAIQTEIN